ncbi:MAG: hypothetical protein IPK72_22545 [Candidatus Eisenbacteria bacterium]|nr:hypothetical protein [Candidatus Eisenbacteria bacterium]
MWAGDVDADGYDDLILGNDADLGDPHANPPGPLDLAVETIAVDDECYFFDFAFADIDGDGDAELLAQTFEGEHLRRLRRVLRPQGDLRGAALLALGGRARHLRRAFQPDHPLPGGDFNGDGRDDLLVLDAGAIMTGACEAPP